MPVSTECAAALLSFRYPSYYYLFTYDKMLKKSNLSTLHNRPLQDISITICKYHMGLLSTYLSDIFVTKSLKYSLRTKNNDPDFQHC